MPFPVWDNISLNEYFGQEVVHEETQILWGTSLGGTITPTNPSGMIDGAFNDNLSSWASQNGDVVYTAFQDTTLTDFSLIQKVLLKIRLNFSATNVNDTFSIQVWDGAVWTEITNYSASGDGFATTSIITLDATVLLNSIAKINGCQVRFVNTVTGQADYTVSIDEARLGIVLLASEEDLWGESVTSAIALINPQNCVDASFNELQTEFIMASGVVLFDALFNTVEVNTQFISQVFCEAKWNGTVALSNDSISFEVSEDGVIWNVLEVFNAGNPWATTSQLYVYNVTSIFNTITKLNNAQIRFVTTKTGGADANIRIDAVRLRIQALRPKVLESTFSVNEFVNFLMISNINVFDAVTVTEVVTVQMSSLNIDAFDNVSITEDATPSITELNFDVFELSGLLVTEHTDVVDLSVEVGVVDDFISITESATTYLDVLNFSVEDTLSITENVALLIPTLYVVAEDNIGVTEFVSLAFLNSPEIDVFDAVTVVEFLNMLDEEIDLFVFDGVGVQDLALMPFDSGVEVGDDVGVDGALFENVSVVEDATVIIPFLNIDEFESVSITEFATVFDIVVELFAYDEISITEFVQLLDLEIDLAVSDDITIVEDAVLVITELFINVSDNVSVTENISVYLDELNVSVFELSGLLVTEHIDIIDLVVEVGVVSEFIEIAENISVQLDALFINIFDSISVAEFVTLLDIEIDIEVLYEDISIEEDAVVVLDVLNVSVDDSILVTEIVLMTDLVIELGIVADFVTLSEDISVYLDELFIDVSDEVSIIEDASIGLPNLSLDISDDITITEVVIMHDIEIDIDTLFDNIGVTEDAVVFLPILNIDASENITITEFVSLLDIEIDLAVIFEDITVEEDVVVGLDTLFIDVNSSVSIVDEAVLSLDVLYIDVEDSTSISEFVFLLDIEIDLEVLFDNITVTEEATVFIPILTVVVSDNVAVTEDVSLYLDVLNIFTFELSGLLITEHTDVLDLSVEVGVVAEFIEITEFATTYLDVLNIDILDTVGVAEYVLVTIPNLFVNVSDTITVTEDFVLYLDVLYIEPFDNIIVTEVISMTDLVIDVGILIDVITVVEDVVLGLDTLFIDVADVITVAEFINILDIIIEIPLVFDSISVVDILVGEPPIEIVFFVDVWDSITVVENIEFFSDLFIDVNEDIFTIEDILALIIAWDLHPRLFTVTPRKRIFEVDETIYEQRYYDRRLT